MVPEAAAQTVSPESPSPRALLTDPRVTAWSAELNAGRSQAAASAIARDLASASPHPFAAHAWIMVQRKLGNPIDVAVTSAPERGRDLVAREAAVWRAADGNRWAELSAMAGASGIPEGLSPWAIDAIWRGAQAMGQPDAMFVAVDALLRRYPDSFAGANLGRALLGAYAAPIHRERLERLANQPELAGSPGAAFLRRVLADRGMEAGDRAAIVATRWHTGNDWFADTYIGLIACDQSWYARCRERREAAARAYPFASDRSEPLLAAVFRDEGAAAMEQRLSERVRGDANPVLAGHRERARALFAAGEQGATRRALEAGLKMFPDDVDLLGQMAALEKADGRHAQASALYRRLVAKDSGNADYWTQLIEIHQAAEDFDGAESVWNDAVAALKSPIPDPGLANLWMQVLIKRDEAARAITIGEQAAARAPAYGWTWRNLADANLKLGKQDMAQAMLERAHVENGVTRWTADRMAEIAEAKQAGSGDSTLAALAKAYPWVRAIADAQNERAGAGKDSDDPDVAAARVAIVKAAVARAPTAFWPHYYLGFYEARRGNLAASEAAFASGLAALPEDAIGRRASLVLERLRERLRSGNPRRDADAIARDIELAATLGAERGDLLMRELDFHAKTGQPEKAAATLKLMVQVAPDGPAVDEVFTRTDPAFNSVRDRAFAILARYIDRKPYNPSRLQGGAFRHSMWGGSPVHALDFARRMEESSALEYRNSRAPTYRERALAQLGQRSADFRQQYDATPNGPCCSLLYDGWFDIARREVDKPSVFVLSDRIDYVNKRAVTLNDHGIEIERGYHQVSGRLIYYRFGAAELQLEYDAEGVRLLSVKDSAARSMRFDYDAKGRIERYQTSEGISLSFEYNATDKPTVIDLAGTGRIDVTYDHRGQIASVKSSGQGKVSGHMVSIAVNRAFQNLQAQLQNVQKATTDVPELGEADPAHARLTQAVRSARGDEALTGQLKIAAFEIASLSKRRAYARDADERLWRVIAAARASGATARQVKAGLDAVQLWITLNARLYRHGSPVEVFRKSADLIGWLTALREGGHHTKQVAALERQLVTASGRVEQARWLPRSFLANPGYWRRYPQNAVLPRQITMPMKVQALLVRRNGDVVIGSTAGLSVYRRGFWEWFSWDAATKRFSANGKPEEALKMPAIRALAEDQDGRLWVALDNTLLTLAAGYEDSAVQVPIDLPLVDHLAVTRSGVLAGSRKGLRMASAGAELPLPKPLAQFRDSDIRVLRVDAAATATDHVLVGTGAGLFASDGSALARVSHDPVGEAILVGDTILTLRANEVRVGNWKLRGKEEPRTVPDSVNMVFARHVDSLGMIALEDGVIAPAVLTDQGMAIYRNGLFEHLKLPLADRDIGVSRAFGAGGVSVMATRDGVFVVDQTVTRHASKQPVRDILSLNRFGATMIAYGSRVDVLPHDSPTLVPSYFANVRASVLAEGQDGSLITHDGTTILRFRPGSTKSEELFRASDRATDESVHGGAGVSSILVAGDGAIWVTSGSTLYRWIDGKTDAFSMYLREARFPVRADQLARVIETVDGKIWLIASSDGHRRWEGRPLEGGLFEWDGSAFVRRADYEKAQWYLSAYTKIGKGEAIVGTTRGLALHRGGMVRAIGSESDPSYATLRARQPMLFRGTRGAQFGEDGWLFGTAGGVVGYYKGQWITPNRLNWLLPDNHLSQYGARTVHAIGADRAGRILVGTDRGLLIHQSAGNSFLQFLVSENLPEMAFAALETQKLAAESASLLSAVPPDSKLGAQVRKFEASARAVDQARLALAGDSEASAMIRGAPTGPVAASAADRREERDPGAVKPDFAAELARREAAHKQLLADIERDNKSLYQMLELKPLDLDAWRRRLGQGEVVVQYLPTPTKLIIHIASREESVIREVEIKSDELDQRAKRLSAVLASQARTLGLRAPDVDEGAGGAASPASVALASAYDHQAELHWLYQQLLRPIEHEIARYSDVYIAPVGSLTRVPFAALIRTPGKKPEYAAQRFTLGVVPSLYLLDLVLNGGGRSGAGIALFGNPDGTLPGAEAEARSIGQIVGPGAKMRIRAEATIDAVRGLATGSKWVHFATHGVLDGEDPSRSYLVLAGGRRLSVIDAMQLDLSQTEMVVLSACESGVGTSGLEYATLTRAFAHAGATSIIASLWKVDDASTKMLMERFYTHREAGMRPFRALAEAQRDLLKQGGPLAEPAAWSSFLAFGRN